MGYLVLLTGPPGVGKTTAIMRIMARLPGQAAGFYTSEIREGGRRVGFRLTTLDGREGILAHVRIRRGPRVGKYGVDLGVLDTLGVDAIHRAVRGADYVVIDETGKMELLSPSFKEAVWDAIHSEKPILATIMSRPHPWADELKRHPDALLLTLTRENRDELVDRVVMDIWPRIRGKPAHRAQ